MDIGSSTSDDKFSYPFAITYMKLINYSLKLNINVFNIDTYTYKKLSTSSKKLS